MGFKKCRIWCWFWICWKSCKKSNAKKVIKEKVTAIWSDFYHTECKVFLGWFFRTVFQRIRIPFYIYVWSCERLHFVKKVKIVAPYCTCLSIKPQLANTQSMFSSSKNKRLQVSHFLQEMNQKVENCRSYETFFSMKEYFLTKIIEYLQKST